MIAIDGNVQRANGKTILSMFSSVLEGISGNHLFGTHLAGLQFWARDRSRGKQYKYSPAPTLKLRAARLSSVCQQSSYLNSYLTHISSHHSSFIVTLPGTHSRIISNGAEESNDCKQEQGSRRSWQLQGYASNHATSRIPPIRPSEQSDRIIKITS